MSTPSQAHELRFPWQEPPAAGEVQQVAEGVYWLHLTRRRRLRPGKAQLVFLRWRTHELASAAKGARPLAASTVVL